MYVELNIDALVGPSHHFGGLGVGNVASQEHAEQLSSPKKAALEGLAKAELLASLGVPQFLWLPPVRPRIDFLEKLGFRGPLNQILEDASEKAPHALSAAFSSAFMWAANSATVAPACDTQDQHYHFTPANLISSWHRSVEADERFADLGATFGDVPSRIHTQLPPIVPLRDEGAANHMRLCDRNGENGLHIFVHGAEQGVETQSNFYPRHTRDASESVARLHGLKPERTFFIHQNPDSISAGVFHNDVIATSHGNLVLHHERAFLDADSIWEGIETTFRAVSGQELCRVIVSESSLPLADAVRSYLFNSQIVTATTGNESRMVIICPQQCKEVESAYRVVQSWIEDSSNPIQEVHFVPLAESMANGGGPACLRLRVSIEESLLARVGLGSKPLAQIPSLTSQSQQVPSSHIEPLGTPAIPATSQNVDRIRRVVEDAYPDQVRLQDLRSTDFVGQVQHAVYALRRVIATA